ncbi:MAG TPA: hypothetical protein VL282_01530, partial [Tepidisphaeraceae bacterium]|nr:hypothetical protein [Tepidisphaeraceae bacterium]
MAAQLKKAPKRTHAKDRKEDAAQARGRRRDLLLGAILIIATIVAYFPAMKGGFIWDDPDYVTNNHA